MWRGILASSVGIAEFRAVRGLAYPFPPRDCWTITLTQTVLTRVDSQGMTIVGEVALDGLEDQPEDSRIVHVSEDRDEVGDEVDEVHTTYRIAKLTLAWVAQGTSEYSPET